MTGAAFFVQIVLGSVALVLSVLAFRDLFRSGYAPSAHDRNVFAVRGMIRLGIAAILSVFSWAQILS